MCNILEFQNFFTLHNIAYQTLEIKTTETLNQYLDGYWKGSTSYLDWSNFRDKIEIFKLPCKIEPSIFDVQYLKENFLIFLENKLVIYYSGVEECFVIKTDDLLKNLYNFMDFFCYLDGLFVFSYREILEKEINKFCIEVRFFESISGIKNII